MARVSFAVRRFFSEWNTWVPGRTVGIAIFAVLLAAQLAYFSYYSSANVGHRAVVGAVDDDAGWNIDKTMFTRWYNDNGWALYGPFYFRVNHTIQSLFPRLEAAGSQTHLSDAELRERSAHFAIMTSSAISVVLLALLLASILLSEWTERLALAIVLVAAIMASGNWTAFFLRAHPDLMFSACVAAAAFFTLRMLDTGWSREFFRRSACLWGIATCIKLSISLFLPGLILFILRPFSRAGIRRAFIYVGWMFGAYFVVGFPQNIVLDRPVRHLLGQNQFSRLAEGADLLHWADVLAEAAWRPTVVIAAIALTLGRDRFRFHGANLASMWAFLSLAVLGLVSRKILSPADHYVLPFVAVFLVIFACTLLRARSLVPVCRRPDRRCPPPFARAAMILAVFYPLNNGYLPKSLATQLEAQQVCRPEAAEIDAAVRAYVEAGKLVFVDPYVPYPSQEEGRRVFKGWGLTLKGATERAYGILVLNQRFYSRFLLPGGPTEYTRLDTPDWPERADFYRHFDGLTEATLPDGSSWKLVLQAGCGIRVFERAD